MKFNEWLTADPAFIPNWAWLVIVLIAIIIVVVIVVITLRGKNSAKKSEGETLSRPAEKEAAVVSAQKVEVEEEHETEPVEEESAEDEKPEDVKEEEFEKVESKEGDMAQKKEEKPVTTVKKTEAVEKSADATKKNETMTEAAKKPATKTYHISLRKGDGKWQVKIGGGEKAIKLFDTQLQAIDYAKALAENQDANIVIHKKDGTFRKLTY